jgi:hypothetical protein
MSKNHEFKALDQLFKGGSFEVNLANLYLSASEVNRERIVEAFREYFIPPVKLRLICSTQRLSISKTMTREMLK